MSGEMAEPNPKAAGSNDGRPGPVESFYQGLPPLFETTFQPPTPEERSHLEQLYLVSEESYRAGQHAKMRLKLAAMFMAQAASMNGVQTFIAEAFCQSRFTLADASLSYADALLARWKETTPPVILGFDKASGPDQTVTFDSATGLVYPADSEGGEV